MPSTCWNSTAATCAASPGRTVAGSLRGYYVALVMASNFPITWKALTATRSFRHACAMGLEGIVAKRRDKPYRSGRSPDWIKVKNPNAPAVTRLIEG